MLYSCTIEATCGGAYLEGGNGHHLEHRVDAGPRDLWFGRWRLFLWGHVGGLWNSAVEALSGLAHAAGQSSVKAPFNLSSSAGQRTGLMDEY